MFTQGESVSPGMGACVPPLAAGEQRWRAKGAGLQPAPFAWPFTGVRRTAPLAIPPGGNAGV